MLTNYKLSSPRLSPNGPGQLGGQLGGGQLGRSFGGSEGYRVRCNCSGQRARNHDQSYPKSPHFCQKNTPNAYVVLAFFTG